MALPRRLWLVPSLFLILALLTGCNNTKEKGGVFIVPPATAPVEHILACETGGWAERLSTVSEFGTKRIYSVPAFGPDGQAAPALLAPWTMDEWLIGFRGCHRVVLYLPNERSLDEWGDAFFRKEGWERFEIGKTREIASLRRFDKGGNVLASPPLPGFPHGRIIVGRSLQQELKEFFRQQRLQASPDGNLIEIDTDWLKIGHVDEIIAFVTARDRPGFRVVLPDFQAGLRILASVPVERALFYAQGSAETAGSVTVAGARFIESNDPLPPGKWKYLRIISGVGSGQVAKIRKVEDRRITIEHVWDLRGETVSQILRVAREARCETMPIWFETPDATSRFVVVEDTKMWLDGTGEQFPALVSAGELSRDPSLQRAAKICTQRFLAEDSGVQDALEVLGIRAPDTLRLPVLYSSDDHGACAVALLPNPVNLVPLDKCLVLLRPFGPRGDPSKDESDLFEKAWKEVLERARLHPIFLDGWDALHRMDGGAHCGTNVIRRGP